MSSADGTEPTIPKVSETALLHDNAVDEKGFQVPDHIGNYRIIRFVGRGGMGKVYEAQQDNPQRRVRLRSCPTAIASGKR